MNLALLFRKVISTAFVCSMFVSMASEAFGQTLPPAPAPTATQAPTATAPTNPFTLYGTAWCSEPTTIFGIATGGTTNTTQSINVNFNLSSILACFSDKQLATSYIQWMISEYYYQTAQQMVAGTTVTITKCQACFSPQTGMKYTCFPPVYVNLVNYINSFDPGFDPSILFTPGELLCAQTMLDSLVNGTN